VHYSANSHIRQLHQCSDAFFICKIAIDAPQRRLLQDEFLILRRLSNSPAPIVRIHLEPLENENGIFGFKMERLQPLNSQPLPTIFDQIRTGIRKVHEAGVVHYDLSPSNIMLNGMGRVTILDFGRSGLIGDTIPTQKARFHETADKYD
jgi:serine/threonine protein kinase